MKRRLAARAGINRRIQDFSFRIVERGRGLWVSLRRGGLRRSFFRFRAGEG